jgi:Iron only hydrogenase large subunit, C-terminal domain
MPPVVVYLLQAVMGTLVKQVVGQQRGLDPGRIYHTAIMPCYDKKLEASRSDFNLPGGPCQCNSQSGTWSPQISSCRSLCILGQILERPLASAGTS